MRVDRAELSKHLTKLACGGQIEGAVFHNALAAEALTADQLLLVVAPELSGAEELTDLLGIPWLPTWIDALRLFSHTAEEEEEEETDEDDVAPDQDSPAGTVQIFHDGAHLVVDEGSLGTLRLQTAAPQTIGTFIEPDKVEKLQATIPKGKGIALTPDLIVRIRTAFRWAKATEVELFLGPGGGKVRVGDKNSNMAEFEAPALKDKSETSRLFGHHLIDVLGVTTGPSVRMKVGEGLVVIEDGGYQYLLAPRSRGADANI